MNISELLESEEGKTLEFKRDFSSMFGILKTIIAFANTAGGIILVGIEDKTKKIVGIESPLINEERIVSAISDNIAPQIIPSIEIISYKKCQIVALEIYPSSAKPHYLIKNGQAKGTFLRVGSSNRIADEQSISEMRRSCINKSFDEEPMAGLNINDVDLEIANRHFEDIKKISPKVLESLNILTKHQGINVPTVGGILLFGKNREKYFPDAWIKAGSFKGRDKSKIIDNLEIHEDLISSIYESIKFIEKNLFHEFIIGKVIRSVKTSIPTIAIREAIINAIVHADYSQKGSPIRIAIFSNRIEIENPGLLPLGLTISDIKSGVSKLRNRVLGKIFLKLGLVEQWGSGIQRIISVSQKAGVKEPIFEEIGTHFRVTLFSEVENKPDIDDIDTLIINCLKRDKISGLSTKQIAEEINYSVRSTRTRLINLIKKGLVKEISLNKNDPNKKYILI